MKIWAHRGCSQNYPENTLTSFEKAMNVPGLTGIELDIQLTSDGELVVLHDERVDRTTDGIGFVKDMSLKELRSLHIHNGFSTPEKVPTMREVLELLCPKLKQYRAQDRLSEGNPQSAVTGSGLRLNIELKTGNYSYPGIEARIVDLVREFAVEDAIVYSSFYAESLVRIHRLSPDTEICVLDSRVSDCYYKALGLEQVFAGDNKRDTVGGNTDSAAVQKLALHPAGRGMDISRERLEGRTVRAWFGGHLYPEKPTGGKMDLQRLEDLGVTDVFLNEPEKYL